MYSWKSPNYFSVNRVSTLQPLRGCSRLIELYLRKNNLESLTELEYLKDLKNLRVLWIDDNPCTKMGEYRHKVVKMLPQITKLDDKGLNLLFLPPTTFFPVSLDDHIETQRDDCALQYDMQSSIHSSRNSQSGILLNNMMMPCIYDTVMEPQMLHYAESIDDGMTTPLQEIKTSERQKPNAMIASAYEGLSEDKNEEWGDFNIEEEFRPLLIDTIAPRMCTSLVESLEHRPISTGRSASVPRRRQNTMNETINPAQYFFLLKDWTTVNIRITKIMSAVSVLLDELDVDGLRAVIEQAQRRIKKQRIECQSVGGLGTDSLSGWDQEMLKNYEGYNLSRTSILLVVAKTLDNRLIDSPSVTCGPDAIRIRGRSEDIFEGQIFIKNQRRSSDCFVVYSVTDNSTTPEFAIPLNRIAACGIEIRRNCKNCISALVFRNLIPHSVFGIRSAVPSVHMSIIRNHDLSNSSIFEKVVVGQSVMLIWYLEGGSQEKVSSLELYGIRVLDCMAQSRDGRGMHILRDGCSYDTSLLSHVQFDHLIISGDSERICQEEPTCDQHSNRRRRSSKTWNSKRGTIIIVDEKMTVNDQEYILNLNYFFDFYLYILISGCGENYAKSHYAYIFVLQSWKYDY
uniref:LRRcap domain-containing protein n=1 Tax=Heterorhabditis bacteriophora TaxID=37862 RepID=A0A1I7WUX5_HETBA